MFRICFILGFTVCFPLTPSAFAEDKKPAPAPSPTVKPAPPPAAPSPPPKREPAVLPKEA